MKKALAVVVALAIAAGTANAQSPVERVIAQERAQGTLVEPKSPVELLRLQERSRRGDPRLLGAPDVPPVQVVAAPGGFEWGDAAVGAASTLGVVLLAAAAAALVRTRQRVHA